MTGRLKRAQSRPIAGALAGAVALATAVLPLTSAGAASTYPGSLRLTVAKVVAGAPHDSLGWAYQAPRHKVTGTIGIDVPAGFTTPQASSPASPGYVSAASGCAQFQVTGTAGQADGSTVITVAVNCKAQQTGTVSYTAVAVPTVAAKYVFAATFTAAASAPVPFVQPNKITVRPGPLASLTISPATTTIATGATQAYTAQGADAFGNPLGDVTATTQFAIAPDGSCTGPVCTASTPGPHTVTATKAGVTSTASLTVSTPEADLSVSQTVDNTAPYYYQPTTFTTTVTNTSGVVSADGVTATVSEPAGLVSPTATPSGTTSYDASTGTWTIGTLAPGASATLTIAGPAGAVSLGSQTVTATVTATTPDPNTTDNTSAAAEASQPAPVAAVITPSPDNPPFPVDISQPGDLNWTQSVANAINPAAPTPADVTTEWECSTASANPCPDAPGLDQNNLPLSIPINALSVDTYTITLLVVANDPNYQTNLGSASVVFQTTAGE